MQEDQMNDWMSKWALLQGTKVALRDLDVGQEMTYAELNHRGSAIARHWIEDLHLIKGERVAVLATFCMEYFGIFSAAQKSGIIIVPLNYRLSPLEIDSIIEDSNPSIVYYAEAFVDLVKKCNLITEAYSVRIEQLFDLNIGQEQPIQMPSIEVDDPLFLLYTSGSTGKPKGVIYTHRMMLWNSINTSLSLSLDADSRTVNCLPPFHTGGWHILTTPILHHGGCVSYMRKFESGPFLKAIESEKSTLFMAVPTMMRMLTASEEFDHTDFSALKYAIVGGESMPSDLITAWHDRGVPVRQGYGLTEYGPNVTSLHHDDALRKIGSIGRANFYVNYRCVDAQGEDVARGEAGEFWLAGPGRTPGYWNQAELAQESFEGQWLKTGDLVKEDEEGFLYVVDRIKNMYISGAENIYPAEIENALLSHPDIEQAVVIGIPSSKWGQVGLAFVLLDASLEEEQIIEFLRPRLAKFKIPAQFIVIEEFPTNGSGKIDRQKLREMMDDSE